jgi:hypothetical protein
VFLDELPDADDVEIQGFPLTLIGVPLYFGVLPRSPPPRAVEYMTQSHLEHEDSFLLPPSNAVSLPHNTRARLPLDVPFRHGHSCVFLLPTTVLRRTYVSLVTG